MKQCLKDDEDEHTKKQNHTARRIYTRLVEEMGFTGGETTVRAYVHALKGKAAEAFVPLYFAPGDAIQIDWGEATVYLAGDKLVVNLFCARLCYSDMPFVIAYRRQNSESFLDALVQAFEFFGGTPKRVIFDNAKVAVKDGFGANAQATDGYAALSAHYGFEPIFCNIASGNEKGLVEGLVGFSRRNFCVPIPKVQNMDELNALLRENCLSYMKHRVQGKPAKVGALYEAERDKLFPLPSYRYDVAKRAEAKVSLYSTVRFDTNSYSVPVKYCGKQVAVKALPERIEVFYEGDMIASHQRCFRREKSVYQLEHYLPLLERKGRAIMQARPVRDNVPDSFLEWLGQQNLKPKELVELLRQSLVDGFDAVMRSHAPLPAPVIRDVVQVATVDLTAYDALCGFAKGGERMSIDVIDEQIRLYAKQMKIPTFAEYEQVLRQADPDLGFSGMLLELLKAESNARLENKNKRRLKSAGFPYEKTLSEFDFSELNKSVSPDFVRELAPASLSRTRKTSS